MLDDRELGPEDAFIGTLGVVLVAMAERDADELSGRRDEFLTELRDPVGKISLVLPNVAGFVAVFNPVTSRQFITKTRVAAASRQLLESDHSIAEIAQACSFYDHSAFTRAFRTATGVTPSEYRRVGT